MSECSWAGGSRTVEKKIVPSLSLLSCESSVSVKENSDRKEKTYQNELDKICFQHGMAYGDFKDLSGRAA